MTQRYGGRSPGLRVPFSPPPWCQTRMPKIILDGEELNYQLHGSTAQAVGARSPLILLHGAGGNLMHWPNELRRLLNHTVYAMDLPGHGHSGGVGRQDIAAYADVVRGFRDALELSRPVLAGHSMGGAIALEFALLHPNRLAGLILVASGARLRVEPRILSGLREDFLGTTELLAGWAVGTHAEVSTHRSHGDRRPVAAQGLGTTSLYLQRLRETDPQVFYEDLLACDKFDRVVEVGHIAVPTLIIAGDADQMTPVKYSHYLAEQITSAQLVIVPGAGHMVMLEHPDLVAHAVEQFLTRLPG
jgi:pimeloyl-ACP methyl ester carboxylesterase